MLVRAASLLPCVLQVNSDTSWFLLLRNYTTSIPCVKLARQYCRHIYFVIPVNKQHVADIRFVAGIAE